MRGLDLVRAGVIAGERYGHIEPTPEHQALIFDTLRRSVNPDHGLEQPTTLQWEFADAEPWHLRIDNGATSAAPGRSAAADLTFRTRYVDWVELMGGRLDPRRAMVTGKLRPRGSVRLLMRLPQILGR